MADAGLYILQYIEILGISSFERAQVISGLVVGDISDLPLKSKEGFAAEGIPSVTDLVSFVEEGSSKQEYQQK